MKTLKVPEVKNINKYWFDDNPSLTHFMSALSVLFPDGERFFMKSMNAYRNQLPDYFIDELNEFCLQEANHGRVHNKLNSLLDSKNLLKLEKNTKRALELASKILNKKQQLALTICLEHITMLMGEQLMNRHDLTIRMESDAKDIWLYHSAEEVEHGHVAFNIYKYVNGNYITRAVLMPPATIALIYIILMNWKYIMKKDKKGYKNIFSTVYTLIGKDGFITNMIPEYLKWFKPNYHPSEVQFKYSY